MFTLHQSRQFIEDLRGLDQVVQRRAIKSLRQLERDPFYPGLNSHSHESLPGHKAMRSRVNDNFRILWEWGANGAINLWRVGKHEVIDRVDSLPAASGHKWQLYVRDETDHSAREVDSLVVDKRQPQPFAHVPDNILRLLAVPDEQLAAVKALRDPEELWDMPLPENAQATLLDILTNSDWTLDDLFDPRQLLYRATADDLEGYCEGKIKQLLLNLNPEQENYVRINASGPVLIKGVAGSGKTTIGLYRAHLLAQEIEKSRRMFNEDTRILVLTYTTTLTKALKQLYEELYGELSYGLTVAAYKEWMKDQLAAQGIILSQPSHQQRQSVMQKAQRRIAKETGNKNIERNGLTDFFLAEVDNVIRARDIRTLERYREIERKGRGIALNRERQRPIVWRLYEQYQAELNRRGWFDYADLARLVQTHCPQLPQYDVVIIDEAQDFPPCDLRLATRLVPNYKDLRSLTLLADPAQSIYYRGIPWKEGGINIQGRTRILAKNYRNTRQILEAARPIVAGSDDLLDADEYIPPTSARRDGMKPRIVSYQNYADGLRFVAEESVRLCQVDKYRPGDIAVLGRFKNSFKSLTSILDKANLGYRHFRHEDFQILENYIKLVTMHSAKGLEFPVVFVIGLDGDYFPYIHKDSRTRKEDALAERKLFYVSMTRAAERLYLIYPQNNPSQFLRELAPESVSRVGL